MSTIKLLHISDLHIKNMDQATVFKTQLIIDLEDELKITKVDYILISGDIADHATIEEYNAALHLLQELTVKFNVDRNNLIIVPGNHDLNWYISEKSYNRYIAKFNKLQFKELRHIDAGDIGIIICDEDIYKDRFKYFNENFYKCLCSDNYPSRYDEQGIMYVYPKDNLLFLGLNSAWQIDHYNVNRSGIKIEALARALDKFIPEYLNYVKIAVIHHPLLGNENISNDFLELLAVKGFQLFFHGHIHNTNHKFYKYDEDRQIHVISTGAFGAASYDQELKVPMQYNILSYDTSEQVMNIETRKKQKPEGAWSACNIYGTKGNYSSSYEINLKKHIKEEKNHSMISLKSMEKLIVVNGGKFRFIEGGIFYMGSDDYYDQEKPRHQVKLFPYFIGVFPITNREFEIFTKETNYITFAENLERGLCMVDGKSVSVYGANWQNPKGSDSNIDDRGNHPVVHVNWYDAKEYCKWLSIKTGLDINLPTEAQWEYAAAGVHSYIWPLGNSINSEKTANYDSSDTCDVDNYAPNEFGIYDMSGNVYEFCCDYFSDSWVNAGHKIDHNITLDPIGPNYGNDRVLKGGSWFDTPKHCRCAHRMAGQPDISMDTWGFRCSININHKLLDILKDNNFI